jgi:hypothetical protein
MLHFRIERITELDHHLRNGGNYVSYFILNASVVNNFILLDLNTYVYINRQMYLRGNLQGVREVPIPLES